MADLSTTYMGIALKNPIIMGASSIVEDLSAVKKLVRSGVSAIVYRSLFEEQLNLEKIQLDEMLTEYDHRNAEMVNIFPTIHHGGAKEHLFKLRKLIEAVDVPVFASINAINEETWIDYARSLESTGVAGLELNFYDVPVSINESGDKIEERQIRIVKKLKKEIKIPIAVKLSPFYANPLNFISKLDTAGASGFVLFNRFFQPEINIENEEFFYPFDLTHSKDYQLSLRFTGLLFGQIKGDICASRGISDGNDVIKLLLAGAPVIQVVSAIYRNKADYVNTMLETLESWMDSHGYKSISDFQGKLSMAKMNDPYAYRRAHYVDILMKSKDILKKYPMI